MRVAEFIVRMMFTTLTAVIASSGFWAYLSKKDTSRKAETRMIRGIGHDIIITRGLDYIERGSISKDEYENLIDYLYNPYKEMNGNGSADRIISEVQKLPVTRVRKEGPL